MIQRFINNLRLKNKDTIHRASIVFAAVATVLIVVLWLFLVPFFKTETVPQNQEASAESMVFSNFVQDIGEQFDSFSQSVKSDRQEFQISIDELQENLQDQSDQDLQEQQTNQELEQDLSQTSSLNNDIQS